MDYPRRYFAFVDGGLTPQMRVPSLLYIILIFYMYKIITMTHLYIYFLDVIILSPTKQQQYWSKKDRNQHSRRVMAKNATIFPPSHFFFATTLSFLLLQLTLLQFTLLQLSSRVRSHYIAPRALEVTMHFSFSTAKDL